MALPILCFHKCGPITETGRKLNVEPDRLASHVRFFQRRKATFVCARHLKDRWPESAVCFTFDDGYTSTLTHGVEALARSGAVATIYVVPSKVGLTSNWEGGDGDPLGGWDLLESAAKNGIEIGSHTWSHAKMDLLDESEQGEEIRQAQQALRERGFEPESFCHPYGRYNDTTLQVLKGTGCPVALALGKRPAKPGDTLLALPRIVMAYSDGLPMLLYKLHVRHRLP